MAVPEQTPYKEYIGNGVTKIFPLEFDVLEQDHLIVLVNDFEPTVGSWSLDAANDTVAFALPPANGANIKIRRDTPLERSNDYKNYNSSLKPEAINSDLDNIWRKLQEMGVLNWMIDNNIKDLGDYVDGLNDETKEQFLAEIQKQGISLNQLEQFTNSIYQNLANVAVSKGWFAEFVADGSENQKQINDKTTQYLPYFSSLKTYTPRQNGQVVVIQSYNESFRNEGGGRVIFVKNDSDLVNNINIFSGVGGNWHRIDWDNPSVFDAGINFQTNDVTEIFQKLCDLSEGKVISLKNKKINIKSLDIPTKTGLFNGKINFLNSEILTPLNNTFNGYIVGKNRTDRSLNAEIGAIYQEIPTLENVSIVDIEFTQPDRDFNRKIMLFHKTNNLTVSRCKQLNAGNSTFLVVVGGMHGTNPTGLGLFDLLPPKNGWCDNIKLTDNTIKAGNLARTGDGKYMIVPMCRLVACSNSEISGNKTEDMASNVLFDAYCYNCEGFNNRYNLTEQVIGYAAQNILLGSDIIGCYVGQCAYGVNIYNNIINNALFCSLYVEGAKNVTLTNNTATYSESVFNTSFYCIGINIQSNHVAVSGVNYDEITGVEALNISGNIIRKSKSPLWVNGTTADSHRKVSVNNNVLECLRDGSAVDIHNIVDSKFTNNQCNGNLSLSRVSDCTFSTNLFKNKSNFALFIAPDRKKGLIFEGNSFIVSSGFAIYNSGNQADRMLLNGGTIIGQMQQASSSLNFVAKNYDNGVSDQVFTHQPIIDLNPQAVMVINIPKIGIQQEWGIDVTLQNADLLYTNNGILLDVKAIASLDSVKLMVRNIGASRVNFTATLIFQLNTYMHG